MTNSPTIPPRRLALTLALALGLGAASHAHGGILNHAETFIGATSVPEIDSRRAQGGLQASDQMLVAGPAGFGSARAYAGLDDGGVLALRSATVSADQGGANANATWYDEITVTSSDGSDLPSVVRLTFEVGGFLTPAFDAAGVREDGTIDYSFVPYISTSMQMAISGSTPSGVISGVGGQVNWFSDLRSYPGRDSTLDVIGSWDSVSVSAAGPVHAFISFDLALGGGMASWNATLATSVQTTPRIPGTSATSDFFGTAHLVGVTLPEFGGLDPKSAGFTMSFDSGLNVGAAAVPEPASLISAALGATVLLAWGRRRAGR